MTAPVEHFPVQRAGRRLPDQRSSVAKWALSGLTCDAPGDHQHASHRAGDHPPWCRRECLVQLHRVATACRTSRSPQRQWLVRGRRHLLEQRPGQPDAGQAIGSQSDEVILRPPPERRPRHRYVQGLLALAGSTKFKVWFLIGNVDVTSRVRAGTYKVSLNPGQQITMEIRVKAKSSTKPANTRNIDLTMRSKSAASAKDIVRAHVTRA